MISIHQYETFLSFWKRNKNINMLKMISMAADVACTENLARKKWWQHPSHYEFCDLIFDVNIDYDFHFLSHSTSDIFVLAQMSKIIQSTWPFGISIKYTFIQNHCKTTVCRKRAIVFFKNEFARKKNLNTKQYTANEMLSRDNNFRLNRFDLHSIEILTVVCLKL